MIWYWCSFWVSRGWQDMYRCDRVGISEWHWVLFFPDKSWMIRDVVSFAIVGLKFWMAGIIPLILGRVVDDGRCVLCDYWFGLDFWIVGLLFVPGRVVVSRRCIVLVHLEWYPPQWKDILMYASFFVIPARQRSLEGIMVVIWTGKLSCNSSRPCGVPCRVKRSAWTGCKVDFYN